MKYIQLYNNFAPFSIKQLEWLKKYMLFILLFILILFFFLFFLYIVFIKKNVENMQSDYDYIKEFVVSGGTTNLTLSEVWVYGWIWKQTEWYQDNNGNWMNWKPFWQHLTYNTHFTVTSDKNPDYAHNVFDSGDRYYSNSPYTTFRITLWYPYKNAQVRYRNSNKNWWDNRNYTLSIINKYGNIIYQEPFPGIAYGYDYWTPGEIYISEGKQGPPGLDNYVRGQKGPPGNKGPNGDPNNNQGAKGDRGKQGPQGEKGAPGKQGQQGSTGSQGTIGPQGKQGPIGPIGPTGPMGTKGPIGIQGITGVTGFQGPLGYTGPQGRTGNRGVDGISYVGPIGPPGLSIVGKKGDTVIGPRGTKGPQGPQGDKGPSGQDGQDGQDGLDGTDGKKGEKGDLGDNIGINKLQEMINKIKNPTPDPRNFIPNQSASSLSLHIYN